MKYIPVKERNILSMFDVLSPYANLSELCNIVNIIQLHRSSTNIQRRSGFFLHND